MAAPALSDAELARLGSWPAEIAESDLAAYFTLSVEDLRWLRSFRSSAAVRLGLAVHLCALRFLGFVPADVAAPANVTARLAKRAGATPGALGRYAQRQPDGPGVSTSRCTLLPLIALRVERRRTGLAPCSGAGRGGQPLLRRGRRKLVGALRPGFGVLIVQPERPPREQQLLRPALGYQQRRDLWAARRAPCNIGATAAVLSAAPDGTLFLVCAGGASAGLSRSRYCVRSMAACTGPSACTVPSGQRGLLAVRPISMVATFLASSPFPPHCLRVRGARLFFGKPGRRHELGSRQSSHRGHWPLQRPAPPI